MAETISRSIFKAYDIRGIVDKTLTEEVCEKVGMALGTLAQKKNVSHICVGRDGRLSGPRLQAALMKGIRKAGVGVYDIGAVPTPVLYFSTVYLKTGSGVAVTGSHNPPDYNGLKMMLADETLYGPAIQHIYEMIVNNELCTAEKEGPYEQVDVVPAYMEKILSDVKLSRPIKAVVDAGNGIAGPLAVDLLTRLGVEVQGLFTNVDGHFPNHHPDPSKLENLEDLKKVLREGDAEIGIAYDGDGDRLGVVTKDGEVIFPDRQAMLFAGDILAHKPGAVIVHDVKCTRNIRPYVESRGGVCVMSRTADANAPLKALPNAVSTPELQIPTEEGENVKLVERLKENAKFDDAQDIITIDGIRVEWKDGFALARPSNTTPVVVLRFEADTPEALARIQDRFKEEILKVAPDAKLPF